MTTIYFPAKKSYLCYNDYSEDTQLNSEVEMTQYCASHAAEEYGLLYYKQGHADFSKSDDKLTVYVREKDKQEINKFVVRLAFGTFIKDGVIDNKIPEVYNTEEDCEASNLIDSIVEQLP